LWHEVMSLKFVAVSLSVSSDANRRKSRSLTSLRFGRDDTFMWRIIDSAYWMGRAFVGCAFAG
jgi:hypothetical protein